MAAPGRGGSDGGGVALDRGSVLEATGVLNILDLGWMVAAE
jgi:hypothetical protein